MIELINDILNKEIYYVVKFIYCYLSLLAVGYTFILSDGGKWISNSKLVFHSSYLIPLIINIYFFIMAY